MRRLPTEIFCLQPKRVPFRKTRSPISITASGSCVYGVTSMDTVTFSPMITRPGPRIFSFPSRNSLRPMVTRGRNMRHQSVKHLPRNRPRIECKRCKSLPALLDMVLQFNIASTIRLLPKAGASPTPAHRQPGYRNPPPCGAVSVMGQPPWWGSLSGCGWLQPALFPIKCTRLTPTNAISILC